MKYFFRSFVVVALAVMATGCWEIKMQLFVKKDGSGTLTMETLMTADSAKKIAGMEGGIDKMKKDMMDTKTLTDAAKQFGTDVKFVKATPIEKDDGSFGVKAVYSFADINTVSMDKVNPGIGADSGGGGINMGMTFAFAKGETPKLTIQTKEVAKPTTPKTVPTDAEIDMSLMQMQMMAGMKIDVSVKVDGTIATTNAEYVNEENDEALLMHMDLDKMMADKENLKKAIKMGMDDPSVLIKVGVAGAKIEKPGKTVEIEFK